MDYINATMIHNHIPLEYLNQGEINLFNKHYSDCQEEIPEKILKKIYSRYLNFENLRKSQGEEAISLKLKNLNSPRRRSMSLSSTSSNESTKSDISFKLYDGITSYASVVKGN